MLVAKCSLVTALPVKTTEESLPERPTTTKKQVQTMQTYTKWKDPMILEKALITIVASVL